MKLTTLFSASLMVALFTLSAATVRAETCDDSESNASLNMSPSWGGGPGPGPGFPGGPGPGPGFPGGGGFHPGPGFPGGPGPGPGFPGGGGFHPGPGFPGGPGYPGYVPGPGYPAPGFGRGVRCIAQNRRMQQFEGLAHFRDQAAGRAMYSCDQYERTYNPGSAYDSYRCVLVGCQVF